MISGGEIRRLRKEKGWTQQVLATLAEVSKTTVVDWEKGRYSPEGKNLANLARALGVSMGYLLGESPDLPPGARILTPEDTFSVPVLTPAAIACAGFGNGGMDGIILETEEFVILPKDWIGTISVDRDKQPFIVKVEGDSMTEANIPDGAEVVINPAVEVYNGNVVLACYGQKNQWAIKWVFFHPNGDIELRSSSTRFPPMIYTHEDREDLRIIGKVVRVMGHPKLGA